MEHLSLVQTIAVWVIPVLFAVTVHETAHGWVASKLGDKTAFFMGRLTLNPIKHIDLMGTIIVPMICLSLGGFVFGWAKPVPINWRNLKNPRRDTALVAISGPLSNFLMAIFWLLIAKVGILAGKADYSTFGTFAYLVGGAGVSINLALMILNLLPIPPLDGSRVVASLLPLRLAMAYNMIESYGLIILIVLIFTNVLSIVLMPPLQWLQSFFFSFLY